MSNHCNSTPLNVEMLADAAPANRNDEQKEIHPRILIPHCCTYIALNQEICGTCLEHHRLHKIPPESDHEIRSPRRIQPNQATETKQIITRGRNGASLINKNRATPREEREREGKEARSVPRRRRCRAPSRRRPPRRRWGPQPGRHPPASGSASPGQRNPSANPTSTITNPTSPKETKKFPHTHTHTCMSMTSMAVSLHLAPPPPAAAAAMDRRDLDGEVEILGESQRFLR